METNHINAVHQKILILTWFTLVTLATLFTQSGIINVVNDYVAS